MVDVSGKEVTLRRAVARALVRLKPDTLERVLRDDLPKGAVFATARIAGIQAAKRTADWIPLCHPLPLDRVDVALRPVGPDRVEIRAEVVAHARTGAEMEALVACSAAALTVYDMVKGVEKGVRIENVELLEKEGGRSGRWRRDESGGEDG